MRLLKITLSISLLALTFAESLSQSKKAQLSERFYGQWVNTALFDSTTIKNKLSPWIDDFYGTVVLELTKDTAALWGCMDGGPIEKMKILSPTSFTTDELSFKPKFDYIQNLDLIKMSTNDNSQPITFRRVKPSDRLDIITDEKKFENYFKSLFFDKFLQADKNLKVDKLWIGFETHTPFEFDAFGVRAKNGDLEYFGWEQKGNILRIFQTIRNTDNDSGFYYWTKGKLLREIKLK